MVKGVPSLLMDVDHLEKALPAGFLRCKVVPLSLGAQNCVGVLLCILFLGQAIHSHQLLELLIQIIE